MIGWREYGNVVASYLQANAHRYDVVDYCFDSVRPWVRLTPDAAHVLKVAHVPLLSDHEDRIPLPTPPQTILRRSKLLAKRLLRRREAQPQWTDIDANMREADLISVGNSMDKECLVRLGWDARKIIVFPRGLTSTHADRLTTCLDRRNPAATPRIAFVGTFDYRKGCLDFPCIVERVAATIPQVRFRLIGTQGLFQTRERVLACFPRRLHRHLEIHPAFDAADLPNLLVDCQVGMFPSYREGCGIAVVEMLGAGLPVIAYDAPGPCDILPQEWLVARGKREELAGRLIKLLQSADVLRNQLRAWEISRRFDWSRIARDTVQCYEEALARKKAQPTAPPVDTTSPGQPQDAPGASSTLRTQTADFPLEPCGPSRRSP
jgi:glycosyltransferase involved in cell wall biosynthesis